LLNAKFETAPLWLLAFYSKTLEMALPYLKSASS